MMSYKFTHEGNDFEIPLLKEIPTGVIRRSRKLAKDEEDRSFLILEEVLGEESAALAALDAMSVEEFGKVMREWTQGATLGESNAS
jgi:hypothetical protein